MRRTRSAFGLTALAGDLAIAALCLYGAFLVRTRVALPGTEGLLPPGDHLVRIDVKDSEGRVSTTSFLLKIAP